MNQQQARRHALQIMRKNAIACLGGVSALRVSDADKKRLTAEFEKIVNYYDGRLRNPRLYGLRKPPKPTGHPPVPGQLSIEDVPS